MFPGSDRERNGYTDRLLVKMLFQLAVARVRRFKLCAATLAWCLSDDLMIRGHEWSLYRLIFHLI